MAAWKAHDLDAVMSHLTSERYGGSRADPRVAQQLLGCNTFAARNRRQAQLTLQAAVIGRSAVDIGLATWGRGLG
jgi:hypothetical protein